MASKRKNESESERQERLSRKRSNAAKKRANEIESEREERLVKQQQNAAN